VHLKLFFQFLLLWSKYFLLLPLSRACFGITSIVLILFVLIVLLFLFFDLLKKLCLLFLSEILFLSLDLKEIIHGVVNADYRE
jgi:hypothetical protein